MAASRDTAAASGRARGYGTRVALALGQFIVHETMVDRGGRITIGHHRGCTFVVPMAEMSRCSRLMSCAVAST